MIVSFRINQPDFSGRDVTVDTMPFFYCDFSTLQIN